MHWVLSIQYRKTKLIKKYSKPDQNNIDPITSLKWHVDKCHIQVRDIIDY